MSDFFIISDENMTLLEVLVINDGSKDNSSSIAHKYEKSIQIPFVLLIKKMGIMDLVLIGDLKK